MELIKKIFRWIAVDGLLHFLVCYAMTLALSPIIGFYALIPTVVVALAKEAYDYHIKKSNNIEQVVHDLICDAAGIASAYATMAIWLIFYF